MPILLHKSQRAQIVVLILATLIHHGLLVVCCPVSCLPDRNPCDPFECCVHANTDCHLIAILCEGIYRDKRYHLYTNIVHNSYRTRNTSCDPIQVQGFGNTCKGLILNLLAT
jgi:hypothetical protein